MSRLDPEQLLDRIAVALREEPVPELVEFERGPRADLAFQNAAPRLAGAPGFAGSRAARRWVLAGATSATLAAAIAALLIVPAAHSSLAFGDVQDAVAAFRSLRYRALSFQGDADPYVSSVTWARGKGAHAEGSGGSEQITNLEAQRMLWLDHRSRKAALYQIYPDDDIAWGDEFYDRLRHLPRDAKPLGVTEFNGKKVLQFAFSLQGDFVVLVDPETKLPLRMELKLQQGAGRAPFREVITDFVFDAPVDESLFKISAPPEYALERCEEPPGRRAIDTAAWIVSPKEGMGGVSMKAPKEKVISRFGPPDLIETSGRYKVASAPGQEIEGQQDVVIETLNYNSLGFETTVSSIDGMTGFRCFSNKGPIARRFRGRTAEGIKLGASIDEVIKAYGAPEVRTHFRDDVLHYFHKGWSFVFGDEKLVSFSITAPMSDQIEIIDNGDGSWTEQVKAK